jgi:predicted dehydrogenase
VPGKWRGWMPFGTGTLGDWMCHIVDPVFWALDLGAPVTVVAEAKGYDPVKHADTFPTGTIVKYQFAAKGKRGPVTLCWYDGSEKPPLPAVFEGKSLRGTNAFVLGDKGVIRYGSHGAAGVRILPEEKMLAYHRPEPTLPRIAPDMKDRVAAHHRDWLDAVRNAAQAGSHFGYGGPLAEIPLLGIIAIRMLGTTLQWDGPAMRFTNCEAANRLLSSRYRDGWQL